MAAVVVLNALGDIFNPETGQKLQVFLDPERKHFSDTCEELYRFSQQTDLFTGETELTSSNTTIGAIITNGKFSKAQLSKIASMTRCAYARAITRLQPWRTEIPFMQFPPETFRQISTWPAHWLPKLWQKLSREPVDIVDNLSTVCG